MVLVIDNENNGFVVHFHPERLGKTEEELKEMGILLDKVPTPENVVGKEAILKFDGTTLYYEYIDIPKSNEEQLQVKITLLENAIAELTYLVSLNTI